MTIPSPARTYDAALFDFGGVMTEPVFRRSRGDDLVSRLGAFFVGEAIDVYDKPTGSHDLHLLETGLLSEAEFLRRLATRFEAAGNPPVDVAEARRRLFGRGLVACAAMVDAVRSVRDAGYRTALVTNNVREWESAWRGAIPVDELFHVVVDSSLVGLRKPDPAIYVLACERLGVEPGRCLFVDDMRCNVDAAEALGMGVVHCTDPVGAAAAVIEMLVPEQLQGEGRGERAS